MEVVVDQPSRRPHVRADSDMRFSDCDTDPSPDGGTDRRLDDVIAARCCDIDDCMEGALMELPGVKQRLEKASKPGGQPDAIFAWPPV